MRSLNDFQRKSSPSGHFARRAQDRRLARAKVLCKGLVFTRGAKVHKKRIVLEAGETRHSLVSSPDQIIQRTWIVSLERLQFGQCDEDVMKMAHPLIRRKRLFFQIGDIAVAAADSRNG